MQSLTAVSQKISRSNRHLDFLIENMSDMVFIIDRKGHILAANKRAQAALRTPLTDCLEKPFEEYFACERAENFLQKFKEASESGMSLCFEEEYADGDLKVNVTPYGKEVLVICQDITLAKNMEVIIQGVMESKREFISMLSHEFRTPLAALVLENGMAKKLNDGKKLTEERVKTFFNRTQKDLSRLGRLVDEMLDVLKLTENEFPLYTEYYNLEEELEAIIEDFRPQLENRNIPVDFNIQAPVIVHWDRTRMKQVVAQLLSNAMAYGDGSKISLNVTIGGSHVYLSVGNQGALIPKSKQKAIFECFERGSRSRSPDGLGIGLFIARKILNLHQGEINLDSAPGKGTTFLVSLPISPKFC